jgi:hypothetical protein
MIVSTAPVDRRDAPGGLSEPVLSAALCRSMQAHLAAPGQWVGGDISAAMSSRPCEGDALVGRDRVRALAAGARVGCKPGQAAARPQASNVRVI